MVGRYDRQEQLVGLVLQQTIRSTTVAIAGVGAIGSVAAELLCRAGIKKLIIIDRDIVEESNLQRQALYTTEDVGVPKAVAAKKHLIAINPEVEIEAYPEELTHTTIATCLHHADLIIDGLDNIATRLLINNYCLKNKKPWVAAGAIKEKGFVFPIPVGGACYECAFRHASELMGKTETCDQVGVMSTTTHIIASYAVTASLKILAGEKKQHLTYFKTWNNRSMSMNVSKRPDCRPCNGEYIYLERKENLSITKFCGSESIQVRLPSDINLKELKEKLKRFGVKEVGPCLQLDKMTIFKNRVIVRTSSEQEARKTVMQYIGA